MGVILLNKILITLFVLCVLVIARHVYNIVNLLMDSEVENKYILPQRALVFLGLSVAYVISGILNGITV
jgi:phosphate starvation-inducible membrane PsiE